MAALDLAEQASSKRASKLQSSYTFCSYQELAKVLVALGFAYKPELARGSLD